MIKTFILVLYVLNASGNESSFVVDFDLTKEDCFDLQLDWQATIDQYSSVDCQVDYYMQSN